MPVVLWSTKLSNAWIREGLLYGAKELDDLCFNNTLLRLPSTLPKLDYMR